jgi:hypothetical protein
MELNKYFNSEIAEVKRSQIKFADYNPRTITDDGKKALKRSVKRYGVIGNNILVNKRTGYTIVSGHQKVAILDEQYKYNKLTKENDYTLRIELIDKDEKAEKSINILLNNQSVGGQWDYDLLREIVPDIDYKDAGLTEADLNIIGVDFMFQTEDEHQLSSELETMMSPVTELKEAEKAEKLAQREMERQAKIDHMKEVKQQVKEKSQEQAENMDAYIMLSFDTFKAKAAFCERFGYSRYDKFIKGEVFDQIIERID